mgnify:CR=1 FL=1
MKLLLIRERKEKMKEIYRMTREEILQHQHVSEKGLTESRVQEIRQKIGENQLQATKKKVRYIGCAGTCGGVSNGDRNENGDGKDCGTHECHAREEH